MSTINSSNAVKITVGPGGVPQKSIKGTSREATSLLSGNYPAHKTVDKKNLSIADMDILRVERLLINEGGKCLPLVIIT